ncbi:ABC transporter ATP-binding protein [Paenibacillus sp. BJ-4]|uniref:ABC transporter ATP-binding protein n=1 Tax=Paenibacillus sp. BJ-4 TaxID=2878097 RepID=UPI001CF07753|nr:ABC transporter ATP-binding protein [Paenibacillus sp. BJ-4]
MSKPAIDAKELTKEYSNGRGCRNVTITVGKGEAIGFLGPNGAGKSTFVKMLVGLIHPTAGEATLMGAPIGTLEAKRQIGYLPELYRYQEWLTGDEVVRLHGRLCGLDKQVINKRAPELLHMVGVGQRGKDRVKHYSKGMQQRLGLACALVNDPAVIFLDEPSSAMDPVGRMHVRSILEELKQQGKTIFLNSHLLEDVEVLCDRMALLNNGQVLRHGRVAEVLQKRVCWRFKVGGFSPFLLSWLMDTTGLSFWVITDGKAEGGFTGERGADDTVWLEAELESEEQAGWINMLLIGQGMTLYEVTKVQERLEEWFMEAVAGLNHRGEQE